jgi:hypothetical protein
MNPYDNLMLIAKADYGEGFIIQLYRTGLDCYCVSERTTWGKTERIISLSRDKAIKTYEEFPIHLASYEEAFPIEEINPV